MVLSLGFILAFIGAAVALLIGILIFSEVSDSIICPAGGFGTGGGGPTGPSSATEIAPGFQVVHLPFNAGDQGDNKGSLGAAGDAGYFLFGTESASFIDVVGPTNLGNAVFNNGSVQSVTGHIGIGGVGVSTFNFLHDGNNGFNVTSINFWINGDVDGDPEYTMLSNLHVAGGSQDGIQIFARATNTHLQIREANTININTVIKNSIPADDSNWHMVTVIYDKGNTTGAAVIGCIDAVCQNTAGWAIDFVGDGINPTFALSLGAPHWWTSHVENDVMNDDMTIWNGWKLTQAEINTMWNGGEGGGASSPAQQGSEECENAKDTAWTVIGILPVALFFALFAIFGALGRNN